MHTRNTFVGELFQGFQQHAEGVDLSLNGTIALLRRRWMILAAVTATVVGLTMLVLLVTPREYTAKALLQINTRSEQVMKMEDVVSGLAATDPAIRTEVDVIESRRVARRVIEKLGLVRRPEFMPQSNAVLASLVNALKMYVGVQDMASYATDSAAPVNKEISSAFVDAFLGGLDVSMSPRSYTIAVRYTAYDPKLAAEIANAVADAYLESQLEDRFEATRRANAWVNERLKELQRNVQAADLAVQRFRERHGLTEARGITLNEQQLSELNSQLILARTQLAEAEAKLDRSRELQRTGGRGIETATEVLNNPLIQNLRQQETQVRRDMSDLSARYGEKHPRMITVRNELRDIQRKIYEESTKIQGSLENEVAIAQARVNTLEIQLNKLQSNLGTNAEVQLAELVRQSEASRSLYEAFLLRSKEISQMDFAQSDAKVISAAEAPRKPSAPKTKLLLVLALVVGVGMGVAVILLIEALDSGFRTVAQVEHALGVPVLGMLGELPKDVDVARYVSAKPQSAFAESMRAIKTSVQYANPDKDVKVWGVTSSVPEEGKSTAAMALSQTLAMAGGKVLLVDADLRRPSIARLLKIKPAHSLDEVLVGKATLKDAIVRDKQAGIDVLAARADTKFAQELLGSRKMTDMMDELRKKYDSIVIDTPPVMAVADMATLAPMVDAFVYCVRWGTTPRALAATAMRQLRHCRVAVTGAIFSRVDLTRQMGYGAGDYSYYYGRYKGYYEE